MADSNKSLVCLYIPQSCPLNNLTKKFNTLDMDFKISIFLNACYWQNITQVMNVKQLCLLRWPLQQVFWHYFIQLYTLCIFICQKPLFQMIYMKFTYYGYYDNCISVCFATLFIENVAEINWIELNWRKKMKCDIFVSLIVVNRCQSHLSTTQTNMTSHVHNFVLPCTLVFL